MSILWLSLFVIGCSDYTIVDTNVEAVYHFEPPDIAQESWEDKYIQQTPTEADIIFIVDNSCSMMSEQAILAVNFPILISDMTSTQMDYHIGVTTTDMIKERGALIAASGYQWIDINTHNPEGVFSTMAILGISGSSIEQGTDAQLNSMFPTLNPQNAGFYRIGADLHIVIVSDENDYSTIDRDDYIFFLDIYRKINDVDVTFSAITANDTSCGLYADNYVYISNIIGGVVWPICSDDWSGFFEELGLKINGPKNEFFLSKIPAADTIEILIEDGEITYAFEEGTDWTYNSIRNSITFLNRTPEPFEIILIRYVVANH